MQPLSLPPLPEGELAVEDPEAREYRVDQVNPLLRFLKMRMLLTPAERALGTTSDLAMEKRLFFPDLSWKDFGERRTNYIEKLKLLRRGAGKKLLDRFDLLVPGSHQQYRHVLFSLLREDVRWTPQSIRRAARTLPLFAADISVHPSIGLRPVSAERWRLIIARIERSAPTVDVLDSLAVWVTIAREANALGDATPRARILLQIQAHLDKFEVMFGRDLVFVLREVLLHGALSGMYAPLYIVRTNTPSLVILARSGNDTAAA